MGIIIKQSIRGTIYSYLGVLLGVVNVLVLMPNILLTEEIGLINLLVAISNIFAEFSTLGFNQVTTRLFSYFRNKQNKNNGYLFIIFSVVTVGFLLSVLVFFLIKPYVVKNSLEGSVLFERNVLFLLPLIFGTLYYTVFDNLLKVLYSSTIGTLYKEVIFRVLTFVNLIFVYFGIYSFNLFFLIYVITLMLPAIMLFVEIMRRRELSFRRVRGFISSELKNQIIKVASFGMLSSVGSIVVLNIDKYLVASYLDLRATGIYSIAFFIGSLILKPSTALSKISSVILADSWKNNDLRTIFDVYRQGCLHLYLVGIYILLGIWINIDNIFSILPEQYSNGEYVVLIIGLAYLLEMISGPGGMIIITSKHFPLLTYMRVSSGLVLVLAGYFLIPPYGINGAALSVLISHFVLSAAKITFIYMKFKEHPFDKNFLIISIIAIVSYVSVMFLPVVINTYIDILVRSSIFSGVFLFLLLKLKVSKSVRDIFDNIIRQVIKIKN
ncbi:MAG: hypothetical protein JW894_13770 [Bacteroidales bacterium]|nr:hypothetical protein [Bacteroidales bacterium]